MSVDLNNPYGPESDEVVGTAGDQPYAGPYSSLSSEFATVRGAVAIKLQSTTPKKDISAMTPEEIDVLLPTLELVATGKTKDLYKHPTDPKLLLMKSRDSITGGDGAVKANMPGKGAISTAVTSMVYSHLEKNGIRTHMRRKLSPTVVEVTPAHNIIPGEFIFRNYSWGSYAKKDGAEPLGTPLNPPVFEAFYKNDVIADGPGELAGKKISDPEIKLATDGSIEMRDGRPVLLQPGTGVELVYSTMQKPDGTAVEEAEFLRHIALINDHHQKLREKTLKAGQLIKEFFAERGIDVSIDGKLEWDINESGELVLIDVFDFDSGRQGIGVEFDKNGNIKSIKQRVDKDAFRARGKDPAKKLLPVTSVEADELVMNDYREGLKRLEEGEKFATINALLNGGNCLWKSCEIDVAKQTGKINILEFKKGKMVMHIFKPGCYEEVPVSGLNTLSPAGAGMIQELFGKVSPETISDGWNPKGADGTTPGATFEFHRIIKLYPGAQLVWKGRHTNPRTSDDVFTVDDTITFEVN